MNSTVIPPHLLKYHDTVRGQIQLVFGPMFSGKSTELIRRMKRYQLICNCLLVKFAGDIRYDEQRIATHCGQNLAAVTASRLEDVRLRAASADVIGIDEGQFFDDIVPFCEQMAEDGKIVIVAALDATFQRKAFGHIIDLVPMAESVVKLTAICNMCHHEAAFTKKRSESNQNQIVDIGGADKYLAVCRSCFAQSPDKRLPTRRNPFTDLTPTYTSRADGARVLFASDGSDDGSDLEFDKENMLRTI